MCKINVKKIFKSLRSSKSFREWKIKYWCSLWHKKVRMMGIVDFEHIMLDISAVALATSGPFLHRASHFFISFAKKKRFFYWGWKIKFWNSCRHKKWQISDITQKNGSPALKNILTLTSIASQVRANQQNKGELPSPACAFMCRMVSSLGERFARFMMAPAPEHSVTLKYLHKHLFLCVTTHPKAWVN